MTNLPTTIRYRGYDVPTGKTPADVKERRKIIADFYKKWFNENSEKSVKNASLNKLIHVNMISKKETLHWACLSFQSTLTVLELSYVLKHAVKTDSVRPKENKNQAKFSRMLTMECVVPKLRPYVVTAKLMVGVKISDNRRLQYCLTAK